MTPLSRVCGRLPESLPLRTPSATLPPEKRKPRPEPGFCLGSREAGLLLLRSLLLLLLRRKLQLHLRIADRRRGNFLGAHVLEHHQIVRRVFLGQAGAGPRRSSNRRSNRIARRHNARAIDPGAVPVNVDVAAAVEAAPIGGTGADLADTDVAAPHMGPADAVHAPMAAAHA